MNFTKVEQGQSTTNVVHPCITGKTSTLSIATKNSYWIIDKGASNYMTKDFVNLNSSKSSSQLVITTVNGSISMITDEGSIILIDSLTLDTILIIPSLKYNILLVSQITSTIACTMALLLYFSRHSNLEGSWLWC